MASLIPDTYNVKIDINDDDIFKIGLVVYVAVIMYHLFRK